MSLRGATFTQVYFNRDEQLGSEVTRTEPGWPGQRTSPSRNTCASCSNEEWEHRLYAERDLTVLEGLTAPEKER